ncbi:hypothetical protein [Streptomyces shenzhenensis]|uniref:Uncharacterized protein n=1 Tax=Streptomyces shenzhenensis TaxID=943815 RepID=A0A3M0IIR3_9ACTN|nr:hypothetical protein [Streptomyces shenzhenensis]RMB81826.1 hypothetical protein CTZ28_32655 [Streptomyces shenzhenensis]
MTDAVAPRASAVEVRTIDHIPLTERHGHAAQGAQMGVPQMLQTRVRYGRFSVNAIVYYILGGVSWIIGLAVICPLYYVLMRRTAGVGAHAPAVTGELFAPATKVAE